MKIVRDMKICKGLDSMKGRDGGSLEAFLIAAAGVWPHNGGHISSLALCWSTVAFIPGFDKRNAISPARAVLAHRSCPRSGESSPSERYCLLH